MSADQLPEGRHKNSREMDPTWLQNQLSVAWADELSFGSLFTT